MEEERKEKDKDISIEGREGVSKIGREQMREMEEITLSVSD